MLTLTTLTLTESDTHIFDYSLFTGLQDWPRDFYRFLGSLTGFQDFFLQVPRISFYRFPGFFTGSQEFCLQVQGFFTGFQDFHRSFTGRRVGLNADTNH